MYGRVSLGCLGAIAGRFASFDAAFKSFEQVALPNIMLSFLPST